MNFFNAIKLLFPRARAFELFVTSAKRKIIKAFSALPEDVRHNAELVYLDLFPDTTRVPEKWEAVFAVYFANKELLKRRAIIESLWKINNGGQSADFLQTILEAIGNIKIIENIPVVNPRMVRVVSLSVCGNNRMICGGKNAVCGARLGKDEFIPTVLRNDVSEFYTLPFDPSFWQMCFFVCKSVTRVNNTIVFIEPLKLDAVWKNYIEYLILRIKPVHSTAIIFIDWIEEKTI